jgi:hypothetical protein
MMMAAYSLAETLSNSEFGPAIAALVRDGRGFSRSAANSLAGYWAERDLTAAREWFMGLPAEQKLSFAGSIGEVWGALQPRELLSWLESLPDGQREKIVDELPRTISRRIGPIEPDRALRLLGSVGGSSNFNASMFGWSSSQLFDAPSGVSRIFSVLAEKSPADAAARALQMPSGGQRSEAAVAVAAEWAKHDPAAARAWAEQIDDAQLATRVQAACAVGLASKDPKAAAEWLAGMPASTQYRQAMDRVVHLWADRDVEAALRWIEQVPDEATRATMLGPALEALSLTNPKRAMELAMSHMPKEGMNAASWQIASVAWQFGEQNGAEEARRMFEQVQSSAGNADPSGLAQILVGSAMMNDAEGTARWALALPPGTGREQAIMAVALHRFMQGGEDAIQWTANLPRTSDSDGARMSVGGMLFSKDADRAAEMLSGVTDKESAHQVLVSLANEWVSREPAKAVPWIEKNAAFSEDEKAQARGAARTNK